MSSSWGVKTDLKYQTITASGNVVCLFTYLTFLLFFQAMLKSFLHMDGSLFLKINLNPIVSIFLYKIQIKFTILIILTVNVLYFIVSSCYWKQYVLTFMFFNHLRLVCGRTVDFCMLILYWSLNSLLSYNSCSGTSLSQRHNNNICK